MTTRKTEIEIERELDKLIANVETIEELDKWFEDHQGTQFTSEQHLRLDQLENTLIAKDIRDNATIYTRMNEEFWADKVHPLRVQRCVNIDVTKCDFCDGKGERPPGPSIGIFVHGGHDLC